MSLKVVIWGQKWFYVVKMFLCGKEWLYVVEMGLMWLKVVLCG